MNIKKRYIITGKIKGKNKLKYLSYLSDGYYNIYFWSFKLKDAIFFNSYKDCEEILKSSEFTTNIITVNGIEYPPRLLFNLSRIYSTEKNEDCEIFISTVSFEAIFQQEYHCEIKVKNKYKI